MHNSCRLTVPLVVMVALLVTMATVPVAGGEWGFWGPWSSCSRSCGGGSRTRSRPCLHVSFTPLPTMFPFQGCSPGQSQSDMGMCFQSICPFGWQTRSPFSG